MLYEKENLIYCGLALPSASIFMSLQTTSPWLQSLRGAGITFVSGVPDFEFRDLIADLENCENCLRYVPATREDAAISLACGAALARQVPLVFMESSGLGNSVDVLTSLAFAYRLPLVLFISWAGFQGLDADHKNPLGTGLEELLAAISLPVEVLHAMTHAPSIAGAFERASRTAVGQSRPSVVLGIPAEFADPKWRN